MAISLIGFVVGVLLLVIALTYNKPPVSMYREWIAAIGIFVIVVSLGWFFLAIGLCIIFVALFSKEVWVKKYKLWLVVIGIVIAIWPFIGILVLILIVIIAFVFLLKYAKN